MTFPASLSFILQLDPLDTHISNASQMQLHRMEHYEDEEHKFCDVDGDLFKSSFVESLYRRGSDANALRRPESQSGALHWL